MLGEKRNEEVVEIPFITNGSDHLSLEVQGEEPVLVSCWFSGQLKSLNWLLHDDVLCLE